MYVFTGLRPFMEATAFAKGRDLHQLGRAIELWHCHQVQNALGQIPKLDPQSQRDLLAHAVYIREGLACALEGVDDAIREVVRACRLDMPACLVEPVESEVVPEPEDIEPDPEIRRRPMPSRR